MIIGEPSPIEKRKMDKSASKRSLTSLSVVNRSTDLTFIKAGLSTADSNPFKSLPQGQLASKLHLAK